MEYCFGAILKIFTVCIVIDILRKTETTNTIDVRTNSEIQDKERFGLEPH